MQPVLPWTNGKGYIEAGDTIVAAGDSITATWKNVGWCQEVRNLGIALYGASAPTWINRGYGGIGIDTYVSNGHAATVIADAPDLIIIELGVNNGVSPRATIKAMMLNLFAAFRAGLPNVRMIVVGIQRGTTEQWGPDPTQAVVTAINGGLEDACIQDGAVPFIDVRTRQLELSAIYNAPAPGAASGVFTNDGLHPNIYGRSPYGITARKSIEYRGILTPAPDPEVWDFDTDATPFVWIESDRVTGVADGGAISSLGVGVNAATPWIASGSARPTYLAADYDGKPSIVANGTTNIMTAPGLVVPAGAKTLFAVYKTAVLASVATEFQALVNMKVSGGSLAVTQFSPTYNFTFDYTGFDADLLPPGGVETWVSTASSMYESANWQITAVSWAGGSPQDAAKYVFYYNSGGPMTITQRSSLALHPGPNAITALLGRYNDGVTPSSLWGGRFRALLAYPGVLTAQQFSRVHERLRGKYGPPV
jgi:lysophospholipase L1-like esterase